MNPEKLSLLSDNELAHIAERMGIYIPEGLDRPFILEEILDALEEDSGERVFSHDGTGHVEEKKLSGTSYRTPQPLSGAVLPERYNETMIRALPRDPAWIYAYWDIAERRRGPLAEQEGQYSLFLRVTEIRRQGDHKKDFFDIPITLDDWKWYINVPMPGSVYRVDLCLRESDKTRVLARSKELRMPLYYMRPAAKSPRVTKSLLLLSGVDGLHLVEAKDENPARVLASDEEI
ncbi:MAG TPA: DUF4912 domain-containing protein [Rectinemataceae bacterium]